MRLSSLLPMLLLLASPLAAQQNCHIFDLTATVVQFDPNSCQFFVVLDFQHNGTTNQFHVKGNGTDYGLFPYGQVPLTLGPLTAAPAGPTTYEFVVQDAVFPDCQDQTTVTVPACGFTTNCEIFDLSVAVGDCHIQANTYAITVDFQVSNPGNDFFDVYTGTGVSLGTFPLASLPLTLPNFPWGGGAVDFLKVCINDHPDCCKEIHFDAPNCFQPGCGILDLSVNTGDCINDSTYKATINFGLLGTIGITDSFKLYLDGALQGVFGLNQLPLPTTFETNGNAHAVVKVCVTLVTGLECCLEKEITVPVCLPPCAIQNLQVQTDSCTSDSTFGIWVNFHVVDSTAVDSFSLSGNGHFIGNFGLNQLPLHLSDFEWNGLIFNSIRVCTGNLPQCCKEYQFLAPDCLPFGPCEITNIFTQTGPCTSDSTYKLTLFFNATNPGNGTFIVSTNGTVLDTFNLSESPVMFPNFPWSGNAIDVVTVCIGSDTSSSAPPMVCCKSKEFAAPNCLGACDIFDLSVQVGDCNPAGGYHVTINFGVNHPGNDQFDVFANGQYFGTYALNQLPLHIPNFPASGNAIDFVKICINDHPNCCAAKEFQAPNCNQDCHIFDLAVTVGDCNPAGGYHVTINFGVTNPGNDFFEVWANGQLFGTYPLNQLPLHIPNFPASGNAFDVIKVCINDHPDCCITKEFQAPNCNQDCHIFDLVVTVGDCNPAGGYHVTINFGVTNPGNDFFEVWANGQLFGTYPLNQLPLHIPNFPASGNPFDVIKVCINDHPDCCITKEFQAPNCNQDCHIFDLVVTVGDCNPAGGYHVTINFGVTNPGNDFFEVWANGQLFGTYPLNQLPLHIPNFPASGNAFDHIKVCINDHPDCCIGKEFQAPHCGGQCEIVNLHVETGDCNPDSTYHLTVNFQVVNSTATDFTLWGNGVLIGTYPLSQLPLHVPNFPWDGAGPNDFLKVCVGDNAGAITCCKTIEFPIPGCLHSGPCDIYDLHVETGACTSDSSYVVTFGFQVANPPASTFGVWANGQFLGMYGLGQLPVTIQNFPWNGGANDVIKVCFSNAPGTAECCDQLEFAVPGCLTNNGDCEIYDLVADPGDCSSDSSYHLIINFQVNNPPGNTFGVWANGNFFGTYNLNQLPLNIPNFPWNGGQNDVVKVCFVTPNGATSCCKTLEFAVPTCLGGGDCEIFGMVVDPGDCSSDSSYNLFLNFQVANPPSNIFGVWANGGVFLGSFNLNQLPLNFPNFPWDGGTHDAIKVCFLNSGSATCCRTLEFAVPNCLGGSGDCHIYDVLAVRTGCLCGQFFVALTFQHDNGSNGGFDIVGNGNNYGTYPYNTQQPIILGPFMGDGTTVYEFGVVDHLHADCEDGFVLGPVECVTPVVDPGSASSLVIAPNPAANWLNVTAMLESGTDIGQATVKIYHADGRLLQTQMVANAASFQLDVSNLPAGVYRMTILAGAGRLDGSFTKQ